jgi:pyruvate dehydrogenase phosphatase
MRNLRTQKEFFSLAKAAATAAAAGVFVTAHANEGNNYPAIVPTNLSIPRFDLFPPKVIRRSFNQFSAHCDAIANKQQFHHSFGSYTYPANNPTEDRHTFGQEDQWTYGAVFDGHGGWQIADKASKQLLPTIFQKLQGIDYRDEKLVDDRVSEAFNDMEKMIIDSIRPAFQMGFPEAAKVGSCVLIALKKADRLYIANCGDCRAILGSTEPIEYNDVRDLRCFPTVINREHNCRVPLEQLNLQKNHPNEPNLIVCKNERACYVKGRLQLTRSLGDAYLKYEEFNGGSLIGRQAG